METSLKTGFAQIFSCCPKNLSCPNFGGAAAPLAPPARTPMQTLRAQLGTETPRIERLAYLRNLPSTAVDYFSDVFNLVKLFLVVLATNAVSGRSAFPLERPKRIFEQLCRKKD